MAESWQLSAQQQPAWAPSAEERWFLEGHRWKHQVGWKGRMVQSPPPITSTLLSNAPSGLTLTLDLFITRLCVSTCRVILFILYCPLKKPSVHLRYLLSSERRTDKVNNYCTCSTFSCKRARYFLQEIWSSCATQAQTTSNKSLLILLHICWICKFPVSALHGLRQCAPLVDEWQVLNLFSRNKIFQNYISSKLSDTKMTFFRKTNQETIINFFQLSVLATQSCKIQSKHNELEDTNEWLNKTQTNWYYI